MHYATCRGCTVEPASCAVRQAIRTAILGLGVTSIRFRCVDRAPVFHPGQRVSVTWPMWDDNPDNPYCQVSLVSFAATVIRERAPGRYLIRVDDGPAMMDEDVLCPDDLSGNGYAAVGFGKLTALDEPDGEVCPACDGVRGQSPACFEEVTPPRGCFKAEGK